MTPSTFIDRQAHITASERPGMGFEPDWAVIEKHTVEKEVLTRADF